jgi:hypothetical protein
VQSPLFAPIPILARGAFMLAANSIQPGLKQEVHMPVERCALGHGPRHHWKGGNLDQCLARGRAASTSRFSRLAPRRSPRVTNNPRQAGSPATFSGCDRLHFPGPVDPPKSLRQTSTLTRPRATLIENTVSYEASNIS